MSKLIVIEGSGQNIKHSFTETEKNAYVEFINRSLQGDEDLKEVLPISREKNALFDIIAVGVVLW